MNLSLSTGDPSLIQEKPDLEPWIIRPIRPLRREITDTDKPKKMATGATFQMTEDDAREAPPRISPEQQQTTTIFHINQPFSIQSGGKEHDVAIMEHKLDVEYQYATVPKRSPHAYFNGQDDRLERPGHFTRRCSHLFQPDFQGKHIY